MTEKITILAPNGFLGYGFPEESFRKGLSAAPDFIGVDAGSTDPGPYYLGSGQSLAKRAQLKRDLAIIVRGARQLGIPLIIGSAATGGGEPHLAFLLDILHEISREEALHFKLAVIHAEIDPRIVKAALDAGKVHPMPGVDGRPLTHGDIDGCTRIVGQMGTEPFIRALEQGAEVIVAGRSCDTAVFAALPIQQGMNPGLAFHLAKILECGALCAAPGSANDSLLGVLHHDHFLVTPQNPRRRCTTVSVAAHGLYEQAHPFRFYEPEGVVDASQADFQQVDERTVRVSGARFMASQTGQTIKLEGARLCGYRAVSVAGIRDALVIAHLDEIEEGLQEQLQRDLPAEILADGYQLNFICYGRDGVLGAHEPLRHATPHEIGLVIEAIAGSQEWADTVCALARSSALHFGFEGRKSTAGNLAFPFSPSDFQGGPVYEFSVYHLMETDDPAPLFAVDLQTV